MKRRSWITLAALSGLVCVPLAHAFADPSGPVILAQLMKQLEESTRQTQLARQALEAGKQTAQLAQESMAAARRAKAFISRPDSLLNNVRDEALDFARAHRDEALQAAQKRVMAEGMMAAERMLESPTAQAWQARIADTLAEGEQQLQRSLHVGVDALHRFDPHRAVNAWFERMQKDSQDGLNDMSEKLMAGEWTTADNSFLTARATALSSQANAMTADLVSAFSAKVDAHLGNAQVAASNALGVQRYVYDQLKSADVAWRARPLFGEDAAQAAR